MGSYMNPLALPPTGKNMAMGSVHGASMGANIQTSRKSQVATASGAQTDRYNPQAEGLDRDSMLDDIIPKSDQQLAKLFDKIYRDDAVAGSAVDLIRTFSWSDYTLSGIKDPAKMKIFADALEMFQPITTMPELEGDVLKQGRSISTLLFDDETNTWSGIIPHDPHDCTITKLPVKGFDPLIDLQANQEMMDFLKSKDKRAAQAQAMFPDRLKKALLSGKAELDPLTTLFVPRRVSMNDFKGTSIYWRILPYYAIEKALLTSTIANARRRTRSILHVQAGVDNVWEPTDQELADITSLFLSSEEDPAGAVIATRNGIQTNDVRSGSDHWKISEEQDSLKTAKLAALGLSDSMLSGEANFNTVDATMTMFVEARKIARAHFTRTIIYNKLFATLARVHGFTKSDTSAANAAHMVRAGSRSFVMASPSEEAMAIPFAELEMPVVHWTKNLSPQSDTAYMDILDRAKQAGIPVTMSMYASAAGIDLNQLRDTVADDKKTRAFFKKFMPEDAAAGGGGGGWGGGGGGAFASSRAYAFEADQFGLTALASAVGEGPDRTLLGLRVPEIIDTIDDLTKDHRAMAMLNDWPSLNKSLYERLGTDDRVDAMKYVLNRAGYTGVPVSGAFLTGVAETIAKAATEAGVSKARLKFLRDELLVIATIYKRSQDHSGFNSKSSYEASKEAERRAVAETSARRVLASFTGLRDQTPSRLIYTGLL